MSHSSNTRKCRDIYEATFDPKDYAKLFAEDPKCPCQPSESFFNLLTHKVFSEGGAKGARCVDVGGGPTVHRLAIASKYCDVLYSSDFLKQNRDYVNEFLASSDTRPADHILLKRIAEIEHFQSTEDGAKIIAARLRSKLKGSVPCDVLSDCPLGDLDVLGGPFDVAISNGCLKTATTSMAEFKQAIKNVSGLLKPQGSLLLMTYTKEDYYIVYGNSFPVLNVDKPDIEEALREAGFEIVFTECLYTLSPEVLELCNTAGFMFCHAQKNL